MSTSTDEIRSRYETSVDKARRRLARDVTHEWQSLLKKLDTYEIGPNPACVVSGNGASYLKLVSYPYWDEDSERSYRSTHSMNSDHLYEAATSGSLQAPAGACEIIADIKELCELIVAYNLTTWVPNKVYATTISKCAT